MHSTVHTHLHALDAQVPSLDDLAVAEAELEGLARLARVELLVVGLEAALVVHAHHLAAPGLGAVARGHLLHHDAALDGPARGKRCILGSEVLKTSVITQNVKYR